MLSEGDIQRIVSRIVDGCGPIAVGTFGSYAVGLAREGSDLDVFVIQRTRLSKPARRRAVYACLFGVMHPLDVHVFTPEEFEEEAGEQLSFAWVIVRQARLYYWTGEPGRGAVAQMHARCNQAGPQGGKGSKPDP